MSRTETPRGVRLIRTQPEVLSGTRQRELELEQRPDRPYLEPRFCLAANTVHGATYSSGAVTQRWLVSGAAVTLVELTITRLSGGDVATVVIRDNDVAVATVGVASGDTVGRTSSGGYVFSPGHLIDFEATTALTDDEYVQAWFLGSGGGSVLFIPHGGCV